MKWKWVVLMFFCFECLFAQNELPKDESKFQTQLDDIASRIKDSVESVLPLAEGLLNDEHFVLDSNRIIKLLTYQGRAHRKIGNYVESIEAFSKVYAHAKTNKDSLLQAEAADQIGIMNTFMGNMKEGQKYLLEVVEIYKHVGSPTDIAGANNGLAIFYNDIGQKEKAVELYKIALKQYEDLDDTLGRANIHANLGMLYLYEGEYDLAEENILMQGYLDTLLQTQWGLGFHHDYMGVLKRKQGKPKEALKWYQSSLDIRLKLPSHYNIAETRYGLAAANLELGFIPEAIKQAELILDYKELHQSLSQQMNAYSILTEAYEQQQKPKQALAYYKQYKEISDSIYQRDMLEEITQKEALYQKAKQDEQIALLDNKNIIASNRISAKNRIIKLGTVALIGFLTMLFFLFKLWRQVSLQKDSLAKSLDEKELLLREIHHRVKNNLQLISSLLTLQGRSIDDATALEAIQEGNSRVRSMALIHQDLYQKENLTGVGVKKYLEKLTTELFNTYSIDAKKIQLKLNIEDLDLDVDTIIPLGLIINELISNSLKYAWSHSQTGKLEIELAERDNTLVLRIEDNGKGFNPEEIRKNAFGTTLISALTRQLGGEIETDSTNGTRVIVRCKEYKRSI